MAERSESKTYLPPGLPAPAPMVDEVDKEYFDAARRHEIRIQRCTKCRTFQFPAEWICHKCHSFDLEWARVAPRGSIYSWERVWHPAHRALAETCPYLVVVVELSEAPGIRLVGNLLGDPRQDVAMDSPVEAVFEDHDEGYTLIQWRAGAR